MISKDKVEKAIREVDTCVRDLCKEYGLFDAEYGWGSDKKGLIGSWANARRQIADKTNDVISRAERKKRDAQRKAQSVTDSLYDNDSPTRVQLDKSFGAARHALVILKKRR